MNKWLIAGTGLALTLGGVAVAQTPPGPPPGPPGGPPAGMEGPRGPQEGGPHEGGPHGRHGGWMGMRGHRPPPPGKAAFFRFHKGDASVSIKCPDDELVKACVDAASALLDKLAQQK